MNRFCKISREATPKQQSVRMANSSFFILHSSFKRFSILHFSFFIFFLLCSFSANAQIFKKRVEKVKQKADSLYTQYEDKILAADSVLAERYNKADIDTAYLARPTERWTFKVRANVTGTDFRINSTQDGVPVKADLEADHKATASFSVSYRGITVGGALNPAALVGKYKDFEINLNSYTNRYGFDIITQDAKRFDGWIKVGDNPKIKPENGSIHERSFNVNAYYVFNHRRFSYPAAFTQSYIQKRSAGSLLVGSSLEWQKLKHTDQLDQSSYKLNTFNFALGAGYAYNFVPSRRWLIHATLLPTFVVNGSQKLTVNGVKEKMQTAFPQVILTARSAVIYNFKNYFLGTNMVFNYSNIGRPKHVEVLHLKWLFRAFVGLRL